jgi:hypothetical protein
MKAIHGGKAKPDKIDAHKIAVLLRGGMLPQAYVYPKGMRETRALLRRRTFLVRRRAEALVHLSNTNSRYNQPPVAASLRSGGGIEGGMDSQKHIETITVVDPCHPLCGRTFRVAVQQVLSPSEETAQQAGPIGDSINCSASGSRPATVPPLRFSERVGEMNFEPVAMIF